MSPLQIDKLQILLNDKVMLSGVLKVLDDSIEAHNPKVLENETNTVLGEKYRAYHLSRSIVKQAIQTLLDYEKKESEKTEVNRER